MYSEPLSFSTSLAHGDFLHLSTVPSLMSVCVQLPPPPLSNMFSVSLPLPVSASVSFLLFFLSPRCSSSSSSPSPLPHFPLIHSLHSQRSCRSRSSSRRRVRSRHGNTRLFGHTYWRLHPRLSTRAFLSGSRRNRPASWRSWPSSMTSPFQRCSAHRR